MKYKVIFDDIADSYIIDVDEISTDANFISLWRGEDIVAVFNKDKIVGLIAAKE